MSVVIFWSVFSVGGRVDVSVTALFESLSDEPLLPHKRANQASLLLPLFILTRMFLKMVSSLEL